MNYSRLRKLGWAFLPSFWRRRKLQKIIRLVKFDPDLRRALKRLKREGVEISISRKTGRDLGHYRMWPGDVRRDIILNPAYDVLTLASTLAHEIHHAEDHRKSGLKNFAILSGPRTSFLFNRLKEAGAFAYEAVFKRRLMDVMDDILAAKEKAGGKLSWRARDRAALSAKVRSRQDGELLRKVFVAVLASKSFSDSYDRRHVRGLARVFNDKSRYSRKESDLSRLRKIVPYMKNVSDRQLQFMLLERADRKAYATVKLMEKVYRGDTTEETREKISKKVRKLRY